MSKKHYIALAKELGAARHALEDNTEQLTGFDVALARVIAVCRRESPRFDVQRFQEAIRREATA